MSQEIRQTELQEKTQKLLHGRLKYVRAAALAALLLPLASVAVAPAVAQVQCSGNQCPPPPPPPENQPGTGTPGYWKNHASAWPALGDPITVGGVTYTKDAAIALLGNVGKNKLTTMFSSLVSAKLNVLIGNDPSCVAGAIDAADAWEKALAEKPDLILMDVELLPAAGREPGPDGWDATRRLKAMPETSAIPVIALTAHAMAEHREKSLAAGCDDFDTKPIELPRLLAKMQALLQKRTTP